MIRNNTKIAIDSKSSISSWYFIIQKKKINNNDVIIYIYKRFKKTIYINPTICSSKLLSLQIVDGAWSRWGSWGACSTTCGTGVHIRYRSCDSPKPAYGGHNCRGANHQSQKCNLGPCPSTSFIICCFDNIASTIKNPSFFLNFMHKY